MRFFKRRREYIPDVCAHCGRPRFTWPRYFTDAYLEANKCPSGHGHAYGYGFVMDGPIRARQGWDWKRAQ